MATTTPPIRHIRSDLKREVRKADAQWDRDSKTVVAYRFSNGRQFTENTDTSGPYAPEDDA